MPPAPAETHPANERGEGKPEGEREEGASLRDLSQRDKERVALLVHHLSVAAQAKDSAVGRAERAESMVKEHELARKKSKVQNHQVCHL